MDTKTCKKCYSMIEYWNSHYIAENELSCAASRYDVWRDVIHEFADILVRYTNKSVERGISSLQLDLMWDI